MRFYVALTFVLIFSLNAFSQSATQKKSSCTEDDIVGMVMMIAWSSSPQEECDDAKNAEKAEGLNKFFEESCPCAVTEKDKQMLIEVHVACKNPTP